MLVAVVAWGFGGILVKQVPVDGLTVSFYRLWLGTGVMAVLLAVARHRPTLREMALSAPAGAIFGVNMVLGFTAVKVTTVANATLIGALQPALVLVVAGPWFGERVGRWEVGWTAVSIAGVAVLIAGSSGSPEWSPAGDLAALLGVVLFTGYFLASKRIRVRVATVAYMAGVHIAAALVVTPVAVAHGLDAGSLDSGAWVRIWAVVLVSGVGSHMLVNWAHPHVRISISSVLVLLTPVVATIGAWIILGEELSAVAALGALVTLGAIVAVARRHAAPARAPGTDFEPAPRLSGAGGS
jgi:drug/metabolite transporter (DMT)-like permease